MAGKELAWMGQGPAWLVGPAAAAAACTAVRQGALLLLVVTRARHNEAMRASPRVAQTAGEKGVKATCTD